MTVLSTLQKYRAVLNVPGKEGNGTLYGTLALSEEIMSNLLLRYLTVADQAIV